MTQKPENTPEKQPPAPVLAAMRVLAVLKQEDEALAMSVAKILPAFAMMLHREGEEVDDQILLEHARQGVDHLKSRQESQQQKLSYAEIRQSVTQVFKNGAYPPEHKEHLFEAVRRNDLREINKCLKFFFDDEYEEMVEVSFRLACEHGHIRLLRHFYEKGMVEKRHCQSALGSAAFSGSLNTIRHLIEKIGVEPHAYNASALGNASLYGHLHVVKYLANIPGAAPDNFEHALHQAAERGHLNVVKYLIKSCGVDIHSYSNMALRNAATGGHLDVVKYLVEKCGASLKSGYTHAIYSAIEGGSLDVVKYLIEERKVDVHADNDGALYASARWNRLGVIRYLEEKHGLKFKDQAEGDEKPIQCELMDKGDVRMATFLIDDRGLSSDVLSVSHQKQYRKFSAIRKKWMRTVHVEPPIGCEDKSPLRFHQGAFYVARNALQEEGYGTGKTANVMAYHASALFGTEQRLLQYISRWATRPRGLMHDLIYGIEIPARGVKDFKLWADAAQKCGPGMAKLVSFADKMPQPEKSADGKTWSMVKTREKAAQFAYKKAPENIPLAQMCVEHGVTEDDFNLTLNVVKKRSKTKNIPEVEIDGEAYGMPETRFYRLPPDDPRAAIMGKLVDCCQSVGGHGHDCAVHSVTSEDGGVYVVETKKSRLVLGEAWAWRGRKGEMCLDTLETLGETIKPDQWKKLLQEMARELTQRKDHDVTQLTVGIGGDTPDTLSAVFKTVTGAEAAKPRGTYDAKGSYRESEAQLVVWKRK